MDAEISELGPGIKSADCPVRGKAHQSPLKMKKRERQPITAYRSHPIPSAFALLPENPNPIPEVGCGQRPQKRQ